MNIRRYKGQVSIAGRRHTAGTGRIIIPGGEDRTRYVAQCRRTYRVSMLTDNGEVCHRVCVGHAAMQHIEFPDGAVGSLGSSVAWVNIPKHNHPIIIDVFPGQDMAGAPEEYGFLVGKTTAQGNVTIAGRAAEGELSINVDSEHSEGGRLRINVDNPVAQAEFALSVAGKILLAAEGDVVSTATQVNAMRISTDGKAPTTSLELTENQATLTSTKIVHNGGKEPMTLGQQTISLFNAILSELGRSTTTTALGPMPLLNALQILALKTRVSQIVSQHSFLD